jgi:hypothetical protein
MCQKENWNVPWIPRTTKFSQANKFCLVSRRAHGLHKLGFLACLLLVFAGKLVFARFDMLVPVIKLNPGAIWALAQIVHPGTLS